jgi:hypothetical protein
MDRLLSVRAVLGLQSGQACGAHRPAAKKPPRANVAGVDIVFSEKQIRAISFPSSDQAAGHG